LVWGESCTVPCRLHVIAEVLVAGCFSLAMTKGLHILLVLTAVFDSLIMSASLPLKGKTICVTGASSGIGAAIAKVCNILVIAIAIARSYILKSLTSLLLVRVCVCVCVYVCSRPCICKVQK
jgi:NADPH:quinone reductase-like Zn-dependent oxidoreductase